MAYRSEVTGCFESEQELDPRVPRGLNRHLQGLWAEALRHKDIRLLGTLEEGRTVSGETDRSMLPRLKGSDDFGTIASWVRNLVQANSVRTIGVSDFASDRDSISYGAQFGMVMVSRNFDLRDQRGRRLSLDTERVIFTLVGTEMRRQTLLHLKEAMIQSGKDSIFDVHTGRQIGWDELEVMIAEMEMVVGNDVVDLVSVMRGGKSEPNSKAARARRNKDVVPFFQPRAVAVQTIDQSVTRGFRFPAASRWALVGLSFSAAAALAACNSRGATIAPVTATPQQLEMTKTPAPVKTPEPTKTAVPTATEAPKFVEYGSLLFGSVSAAEPKNMALAELADKKLKSSIESAAEKQLGLKVAEMGLWSARYDNGVGMVVVFKDNGDGTASQWMAFSQGSNGELLPVGSTDQIVFLQLYQIDRDNGDGTKLIRIGFDEKVTADKDMILPPFIMFTVGADGKIAGEVDMLYPFGQKETKSIKVLASLIERFVPKSEADVIAKGLGLEHAIYTLKVEDGLSHLYSSDGELVGGQTFEGVWINLSEMRSRFIKYLSNLDKGPIKKFDGGSIYLDRMNNLVMLGFYTGEFVRSDRVVNMDGGKMLSIVEFPLYYVDQNGKIGYIMISPRNIWQGDDGKIIYYYGPNKSVDADSSWIGWTDDDIRMLNEELFGFIKEGSVISILLNRREIKMTGSSDALKIYMSYYNLVRGSGYEYSNYQFSNGQLVPLTENYSSYIFGNIDK